MTDINGGDNHKISEETKIKIGAANRIALKGKIHPERVKQKISDSLKEKHQQPNGWDKNRKLSEEDFVEIRNLFLMGYKQKDLAHQFGVDPSYVSLIVNNKHKKGK